MTQSDAMVERLKEQKRRANQVWGRTGYEDCEALASILEDLLDEILELAAIRALGDGGSR